MSDQNSGGGLSKSTYIGYGVGDFAMNLYFQAALVFLLKFYTDTVGLAAASVAGVFLVARIVDAVTDPLMGYIADRTRTRWGKLRPYLIGGAQFLAVMGVATFSSPDWDADGKLMYAYVTYILFGIAYTIVGIPYSSLTASLTRDSHERTKLSSVRMAFALVGVIIVTVGMAQSVEALGGGDGIPAVNGSVRFTGNSAARLDILCDGREVLRSRCNRSRTF